MELELVATVRNVGSLGVGAGIPVTLYLGSDENGTLVGTELTTMALLPGAETEVVWMVPAEPGAEAQAYFVVVDGEADMDGVVAECDESNNSAFTQSAACPLPG
jgi:hypothetical protein